MRVHHLQHVPFEGLGSIGAWLASRGAEVSATRLFEDARFPKVSEIDWLVVMGGPMSANDEAIHPWLAPEKRFIAEAIGSMKAVLGVCLGAQLVASSLGARVFPNREREIGWFEVEPARGACDSPFSEIFRAPIEVFHWHGETFDLPPRATHLARSGGCEHQAFSIGDRVLGLQFHLEPTAETARALIAHCPADLAPARWVQTPAEMLRDEARFDRVHRVMDAVLDRLAALTA
jgi:GMP synthase-like glutamine amidotransferase